MQQYLKLVHQWLTKVWHKFIHTGENTVILQTIISTLIIATPIIIAITFHEAAHGYIALRHGDDTALRLGRISLNPIKHIDVFGTIILPAILLISNSPFLFGWAKPVPVNFRNLDNPKVDMIWVAIAGPATNMLLAVCSAFLIRLVMIFSHTETESFVSTISTSPELGFFSLAMLQGLQYSVKLNLVLALFNMIPLPPLDGGRVAVGLLPKKLARWLAGLERYGMFILVLLIFIVPIVTSYMGTPFNPISKFIMPPVESISHFLLHMAGV